VSIRNEGKPFAGSAHDARIILARLGGYLDRTSDCPPDHQVIWRGMTRLADMIVGYQLVRECG
jgi:hypothetical protein